MVIAEERAPQQVITYVKEVSTHSSNVTDDNLDKDKVARNEEMKYSERMGVYKKVQYTQAVERTGRTPIGQLSGSSSINQMVGIAEDMWRKSSTMELTKPCTRRCRRWRH